MTRRIIISLILFTIVLAGKLIVDLHLYFLGGVNNHLIGPAVVAVCIGVCSWLGGWRSIPMWLFCYWALFDSLYGVFIHQGAFYVGTTAKLDILQRQYPVLLWLKYIGAIASAAYFTIKSKKQNYVRN